MLLIFRMFSHLLFADSRSRVHNILKTVLRRKTENSASFRPLHHDEARIQARMLMKRRWGGCETPLFLKANANREEERGQLIFSVSGFFIY